MATVLITEDDTDIRGAYVFALSRAGHKVLEATDGGQALDILNTEKPDIIVLDMLMPGMSGLDFLRESQVTQRHPEIKVLAFSNIDTPQIMEDAKKLGVSEYFVKVNITPHQMVQTIEHYVGKK